jgi:hypothetical protein
VPQAEHVQATLSGSSASLCGSVRADAFLMTVQVIKVEPSKGDPTWFTAVVAVAAALLGAGVGGFASYFSNAKLDARRRKARAAVRRKAKVYTPLRGELVELREAMAKDKHLEWGIMRRQSNLDGFDRGPFLYQWDQLVDDGRALTAASALVRSSVDHVGTKADAFNATRTEAEEVFTREGDQLYEDVVGQEQTMHGWAGHRDFVSVTRDRLDELSIFGFAQNERNAHAEQMPVFIERFRANPAVRDARQAVLHAEAELQAAVGDGIEQLDAAMAKIADKHEHESPDD